ncbi:MAG: transporter family-2 protein [Parasphingorhabdus sp.]|jgi:transporter family-2 protein
MNSLAYILAAVCIGAALSLQPPINATMARTLGNPLLAATISISISLIVVTVLWLAWGKGAGELVKFRDLPWWVFVGGIIGVVFVTGSIVVAPVLGVAVFFVCVVAGQLMGSMLVDHLGAFGLAIKPISAIKLIGLGLVLAGATLVQGSNS